MFVNVEGVTHAYKFGPNESRVFEDQALARQLTSAAYLPTSKEDKGAYSLTDAERRTPTFSGVPKGQRRGS